MNLLAHLWLAERTRSSAAGQVLGDIVKGRLESHDFSPAIARGIHLHRLIDSHCDAHVAHRALRQSFTAPLRRYAGIVVDIGFDHALARNWPTFSSEPLSQFAARLADRVVFEWPSEAWSPPPKAQGMASVLNSYSKPSGIERALKSVAGRMRRPNPLSQALPALLARNDDFEAGLAELLQDLETMVMQR